MHQFANRLLTEAEAIIPQSSKFSLCNKLIANITCTSKPISTAHGILLITHFEGGKKNVTESSAAPMLDILCTATVLTIPLCSSISECS